MTLKARRWQRVGVSASAVRQVAATSGEILAILEEEDRSSDASPDQTRAVDVSEYALLSILHHLEVEGIPGNDGMRWCERTSEIAVDYFEGVWRDRYEYRGRTVEILGRDQCRNRLAWYDVLKDGLLCSSVADDERAMESLLGWLGADLPRDPGWEDVSAQDNDFIVLLGLTLQDRDAPGRHDLRARITASRQRRPKLCTAALDAVMARDGRSLAAALNQLFEYHLRREFKPENPRLAVMAEGTIFWNLARRALVRLPEMPADLLDRIVTPDTCARGGHRSGR